MTIINLLKFDVSIMSWLSVSCACKECKLDRLFNNVPILFCLISAFRFPLSNVQVAGIQFSFENVPTSQPLFLRWQCCGGRGHL